MPHFHNIAAYRFVSLDDLKVRRAHLLESCKAWHLKGTILLSTEGINLFVAGSPESIALLLSELRSWEGLETLEVKLSESDHQPFNRMLVRIKKEIISFGIPGIEPARHTSRKIAPKALKEWLDEGRPVTLLDTRNDYEVKLGTFENALPAGINHFRQFPDAVQKLPEELKETPIVMFCTGGIRCEKAGPFMEMQGFKNIFQLDGGILKYFEECGSAHYQGECFVFDQRVGVDPSLRETETALCFECQAPLTDEEQKDSRYVVNESCPYCFGRATHDGAKQLAKRQAAIRKAAALLPGSQPYENFRPLTVPARCEGMTLFEFLAAILSHRPQTQWESLCENSLLVNKDHQPVRGDQRVRAGERYFQKMPGNVEPAVNADIELLHEDDAIIVINKPAPLPMHPGGRFHRNTLQYILDEVYHPHKPRHAHRLDANTTGIAIISRTKYFAGKLQPQFTRGEVKKMYLARVAGSPAQEEFECHAAIGNEAGVAGSRASDVDDSRPAHTKFRVLKSFPDGTALLEAIPLTGRTNQIRIHLWQLGLPVCGDPLYLAGGILGDTQTLDVQSPPMMLHSTRIEFVHPHTNEPVVFTAPMPAWGEV